MSLLKKFSRSLNLTPNEGKVIGFLVAGLIIGGVMKTYYAIVPPERRFDYRASDSIFAARGRAAAIKDSLAHIENIDEPEVSPEVDGMVPPVAKLTDSTGEKINLNEADVSKLRKLPGVGPSTALAIVEYRKKKGPFVSVNQLKDIKGIGEKKLSRMAPFIILEKQK